MLEETYPSGRQVGYEFNQDGDLSRVWGQASAIGGCANNCARTYANSFSYNSAGAVEKLKLGNGRWETAKFNNRLQVTEIGLGIGATDSSLWKTNLEYGELQTNGTVDANKNSGNVAKQTLAFAGLTNPIVQTNKYDSLDRISEAEEKSNGAQTWIQQFGYDKYGNRTSFNQLIGQNQQNQTPMVDANTNRFQTGQGYVYDAGGNLITDANGRNFTFNGDNKQTEVRDGNNPNPQTNLIGQYFYDGEGKRVKKVSATETTIFVYNGGGQLVAEYSTQTPQNPTISYLTNDHLGSPRVVTDALGQVNSRRDFMPFGEEIARANYGSDSVRQKFTGYEKDTETGLDFAEARYYNNTHGRFTAVDPLLASGKSANPQSFNRYAYTMNNPTNLVDPSGLIPAGCIGCNRKPNKLPKRQLPFQKEELPEDLVNDISRSKRTLPDGRWHLHQNNGTDIYFDSPPDVTISSEMSGQLLRDAYDIYNRGIEEGRLFREARSQIRDSQEQLRQWNETWFDENESSIYSTGQVGEEICVSRTQGGECNNNDIILTHRIEPICTPFGCTPEIPGNSILLDLSAVRKYNDYVRETNSIITTKRAVFDSRFRNKRTNITSGGKIYSNREFGTFAVGVFDDIINKARRQGHLF